jgi:transposase-like protein
MAVSTKDNLNIQGHEMGRECGTIVFSVTSKKHSSTPSVHKSKSRRRFSAEEKLQILHEADTCNKPGELSNLLHRRGLYHSHLAVWRKQRDNGLLTVLAPKKRGPSSATHLSLIEILQQRLDALFAKQQQLMHRMAQLESIIAELKE